MREVMKLKGETEERLTDGQHTKEKGLKDWSETKLVSGVGTRRIMAPTINQADVYPFMGLTLLRSHIVSRLGPLSKGIQGYKLVCIHTRI